MKIGIIIDSQTGNTMFVAQNIMKELLLAGHFASTQKLTAVKEGPPKQSIELASIPDPTEYDALIFGAPVQAFSLSPVMKAYLTQIPSLQGKKIGCFLTHGLPCQWMGGKRAASQLEKACNSKGGNTLIAGMVSCFRKRNTKQVVEVTNRLLKFIPLIG